jgi:hypothetical protein
MTPVEIARLDGEKLTLDGLALARGFFRADPSSIAEGAYDSLAGQGRPDMITQAGEAKPLRTWPSDSKVRPPAGR